jgi:hypothetical protein
MLKSRGWWLAALLLVTVVPAITLASLRRPGDLPVYVTAASRIVAAEEIYRQSDVKQFSYPPFLVVPALPCWRSPSALAVRSRTTSLSWP